uniref:Uncharacterized protein n=1 Tax=Salix viminalis TaxID=40686 RepID=A0A6N2KC94_SALVM
MKTLNSVGGATHLKRVSTNSRIHSKCNISQMELSGDSDGFEGGFQKSSDDRVSQTAADNYNPSGQMLENSELPNISKTQPNPTVAGRDMAVVGRPRREGTCHCRRVEEVEVVVPVVVASKMVACYGQEELLKWLTCAAVPAAPRCWRWRRKVEADGELLVWGRELAAAGDGEGEDRTGGCSSGGERDAGLVERERELLRRGRESFRPRELVQEATAGLPPIAARLKTWLSMACKWLVGSCAGDDVRCLLIWEV